MSRQINSTKHPMLRQSCLIFSLLLTFWLPSAFAEDEILTIEGTKIRGNQELPTILYLVPWQNPEIQSITAPEQNFAVQRQLKPLERSEFQRLMAYHEKFMGQGEGGKSPVKD